MAAHYHAVEEPSSVRGLVGCEMSLCSVVFDWEGLMMPGLAETFLVARTVWVRAICMA